MTHRTRTGASTQLFGALADGTTVDAVTLANAAGMSATIISYGATLQALHVPDRSGHFADVTAGFAELDSYVRDSPYFGASIGRVANRIAKGMFTLDGRQHAVPANNGANALHGGPAGFDKRNWAITALHDGDEPGLDMALFSEDGDQGFPGALHVTAQWRLHADNRLSIAFHATTDRPTIVNLTNHAYWNLAGDGAVAGAMGHELRIPADHYLPTDATAIPTGEFRPVAGGPFDFRTATAIGARVRDAADAQILIGRGYDHAFAVAREVGEEVRLLAWLHDPASGRTLELFSNQPSVQFYSGNFLDGSLIGKSGRAYRMGDAVALEPQMFPDTPNQPQFGSVRLNPGQVYRHQIIWRFTVKDD